MQPAIRQFRLLSRCPGRHALLRRPHFLYLSAQRPQACILRDMVLMRLVQFHSPVCKPVKPGRLSACTKQVPGTQQRARRQLLQAAVLDLIRLC